MTDFTYHSVTTKSGIVGYMKTGMGPALVLMVGYSGTLFHWNAEFINELAKYFTLYLIDNRKIGLSQSNNEESLGGLAKDVLDFIQAMHLIKPTILGWSLGGTIAQEMAYLYAEHISGLIVLATAPDMDYLNSDFFHLTNNSEAYTAEEFRRRLYELFFSTVTNLHETKDYLKESAIKLKDYHYRFNHEARKLQDELIIKWSGMDAVRLGQITLPTLIFWAKDDAMVPLQATEFLYKHIPNAKLIIYPAGGHFLIHANSKQITADIVNFINN